MAVLVGIYDPIQMRDIVDKRSKDLRAACGTAKNESTVRAGLNISVTTMSALSTPPKDMATVHHTHKELLNELVTAT